MYAIHTQSYWLQYVEVSCVFDTLKRCPYFSRPHYGCTTVTRKAGSIDLVMWHYCYYVMYLTKFNIWFPLNSVVVSELSLKTFSHHCFLSGQVRKTLCRKHGWHLYHIRGAAGHCWVEDDSSMLWCCRTVGWWTLGHLSIRSRFHFFACSTRSVCFMLCLLPAFS